MLKTVIVDDEKPARDELKYLLSEESGVSVVGEADSGLAAINLATALKPAVIFLDVQMRGMSGLETAVILRTVAPGALIVFASAYDEYAVKAFEIGALDYILKPFEKDRIHATVERVTKYQADSWQAAVERIDKTIKAKFVLSKLPVNNKGAIMLLPYDDIIYACTQDGAVEVVTADGKYNYDGTLAEAQARLKNAHFMRVHKSYIVNMEKVRQVIPWFKSTYWLKVEGLPDMEIPVSKAQIKEMKDVLGLK